MTASLIEYSYDAVCNFLLLNEYILIKELSQINSRACSASEIISLKQQFVVTLLAELQCRFVKAHNLPCVCMNIDHTQMTEHVAIGVMNYSKDSLEV